jgi:hypothetical protein
MLSHGVWDGIPDFDGETQLRLQSDEGLLSTLPYYVGPVPKGVLFPLCGMNVMVRREALPYFYFAPMGKDAGPAEAKPVCEACGGITGRADMVCLDCGKPYTSVRNLEVPTLHRFADIWMGIFLKRQFDALGWACYTGASTVYHSRASDAQKNFEQEKLGRQWNEYVWGSNGDWDKTAPDGLHLYLTAYRDKRERYAEVMRNILNKG